MSDSETNNREKNESYINIYITLTLLNKIIESIEDFYNTYNKSKYIRIIKYKRMILIVQKFEEIYTNFWGLHDSPFISKKAILVCC